MLGAKNACLCANVKKLHVEYEENDGKKVLPEASSGNLSRLALLLSLVLNGVTEELVS